MNETRNKIIERAEKYEMDAFFPAKLIKGEHMQLAGGAVGYECWLGLYIVKQM